MMKIKRDKYLSERGGTTKIIKVSCGSCGKLIFVYQKDGHGWLKRCYLNRILEPEEYARMQRDYRLKDFRDIKNLVCACGKLLGVPVRHKDGRLAFQLIRGNFKRSLYKKQVI